ncbi:extracellular solute-binding protein [Aphanizomenon sp. UHCC 0183]|uniref:extracellular solute-binding protein n=1 Tax=Aphanizomenon sp. UHCC 0183 TaxID=2590028 RepID=UPI0014468815|nr:extracellular solute-binding protein [Aphanizomenon sp. UHCC 0183]MTJ32549.1 extracellular solute-binding protein [Aphanizomenon sp. UHCC 0183]
MKNPNFLNQLSGLLQRITPTTHKLTVPLFTVALGLSVTLYACQSSAQKEITLCFAVPANEITNWNQLTEKFNNDNKGKIKITLNKPDDREIETLKKMYSDSLIKDKNTNNSNVECGDDNHHYDLIYTDIIWLREFAQYLLPLDKHFKEEELQGFLKTEIDNGKYKSKLYRIPFRTDVGVLYYNNELLKSKKVQVPKTPEDFLKTAQNFNKNNDLDYLSWPNKGEALVPMFVEVLYGYDGFWINPYDQVVGLDSPKAIKAVKFLRKIPSDTAEEQDAKNKFIQGNSAFLRSWPGVWAEAQKPESKVRGKIGIAPVVGGKGCHGGWGLAIAKNIDKERQEAAIKAVKFLTSRESQLLFTLSHGSVPTRKDLFFDPLIVSRYSHYPELFKMVDKTVSRPRLARYEEVSNILQTSLQYALKTETKDDAVEGIMKKASEDTQKCLTDETKCSN